MQTLKKYYTKGLIPYARVENSYIQNHLLFSYNPHPELPIINSFFEPLKEGLYKYDEKSLLLHLHNMRYITPSMTMIVNKAVEKKKKSEKEINLVIESYSSFIEAHKKNSLDYFINDEIEHYHNEKPKIHTFKELGVQNLETLMEYNIKLLGSKGLDKKEQKSEKIYAEATRINV